MKFASFKGTRVDGSPRERNDLRGVARHVRRGLVTRGGDVDDHVEVAHDEEKREKKIVKEIESDRDIDKR